MVQFYKATLAFCSYLILSESSIYIAESTTSERWNKCSVVDSKVVSQVACSSLQGQQAGEWV